MVASAKRLKIGTVVTWRAFLAPHPIIEGRICSKLTDGEYHVTGVLDTSTGRKLGVSLWLPFEHIIAVQNATF